MLLRNTIEQTLQQKISSMTIQKFTEKHNIIFKLKNIPDFVNFDRKLKEDEEFRADFVSF